jgi:hypothetical protein
MEIAILFTGTMLVLIGALLVEGIGGGVLVLAGSIIVLAGATGTLLLIIAEVKTELECKGLERERKRRQFGKEWDCTIKRRHNELD